MFHHLHGNSIFYYFVKTTLSSDGDDTGTSANTNMKILIVIY